MQLTVENILLLGSILLFLSIVTSKTSFRLGIPTLILFLLIGMLAGSDGIGGIHFNDPKISQFLGIVALNFILFSGGLDTKWESIKPIVYQGLSLSTIGVFVTALLVGIFAYWVLGFSPLQGLLIGAIVSSTDAAAVFSILRSRNIGLKGNLRPTLELESGSNDPMAYFLTITLTQLLVHTDTSLWSLIPLFFQQMVLGGIVGIVMGRVMVRVINWIALDFEALYPVLVVAMAFFTFSLTDFIGGNGFLAIYIAGLVLGNSSFIHRKTLLKFYDGMAWLMQIIMFLTLGLLVYPSQITPIVWIGVSISFFLILVARPVAVFIALSLSKISIRKKFFISWVGLRGAVPIVFAIYPLTAGLPYANEIFHIVFFISVMSVLLQGSTISLMAKWLHVSVPAKIKRKFPIDIELADNMKSDLIEIDLKEGSPVVDKSIVDLKFPKDSLIVLINRDGKYLTPNGSTVLQKDDHLLIMSGGESKNKIYTLFGAKLPS